jgi:hypothetical protein
MIQSAAQNEVKINTTRKSNATVNFCRSSFATALNDICQIAAIGFLLLSIGCAHSVHQVHTSDFTPYSTIERGEMVKGYGEQFTVMGIISETNYVDVAYQELMNSCNGGTVTGITTQISTSLGFFSWTNKALMQGLCVR